MCYRTPPNKFYKSDMKLLSFSLLFVCFLTFSSPAISQDFVDGLPAATDSDLTSEDDIDETFEFDDGGLDFEQSAEALENSFREEAFDKALKTLLPLKPAEIRSLLEHFDRTVESTQIPIHPNPRPELVVKNISLDPGVPPLVVKLAYGYVTTLSMLDSSGQPWPIEDISWVGEFKIQESTVGLSADIDGVDSRSLTHILRISPATKFAHGNISMRLMGLNAPVIMTFETNRELVHYRFDAIVPGPGPGADSPIIDAGVRLTSGDPDMSIALGGVIPSGAAILGVDGVDGRTTAYTYNGLTYIRTPLTLLSPGWDSSVTSADGTKIYALEETPVVLLSDRGRMVRAYLTEREDLLDE